MEDGEHQVPLRGRTAKGNEEARGTIALVSGSGLPQMLCRVYRTAARLIVGRGRGLWQAYARQKRRFAW